MKRYISPIRDAEVLGTIKRLCEQFSQATGTLSFPGASLSIPLSESPVLQAMEEMNGYAISSFNLQYGTYNVSYSVASQLATSLAEFHVSTSSGTEHPEQQKFYFVCSREFAVPPSSAINHDTQDSLIAVKQIEIALTGAVGQFAKLQREFSASSEELRRQHIEEVDQLKASLAELQEIHAKQIEEERRRITEQQKELDDRSNTHVRREIRKELKSAITESLSSTTLSEGLETRRRFVRVCYGAGLIALFVLAGYHTLLLQEVLRGNETRVLWLPAVKATISTLSFIGFLLLYLKWETQWLTQQANFETVLASTKIDIDRASWIAESLLEWNRATNKDIPTELLQSFSRRLFDWDAKLEENSSDSLASSILGSAGRVQLGPDGAQVEFGRRGVKKLAES